MSKAFDTLHGAKIGQILTLESEYAGDFPPFKVQVVKAAKIERSGFYPDRIDATVDVRKVRGHKILALSGSHDTERMFIFAIHGDAGPASVKLG